MAQVGWYTRQFRVGPIVVRRDPLGPSGPSEWPIANSVHLLARRNALIQVAYGVCRRRLLEAHLADDAFQATSLILTRKEFNGSVTADFG